MTPKAEATSLSGARKVGHWFTRPRAWWPLRRVVTVVVLFPVLLALLAGATGGWAPGAEPVWTALVAVIALAAATTLASYLPRPGTGRGLDIGCTPCAAVAGLSVLAASAVLRSEPHDVPTAILALAVAGFGLRQRLANPDTCAASPASPK